MADDLNPPQALRSAQMVWGGSIAGVVVMAAISAFLVDGRGPAGGPMGVVALAAVAYTPVAIVAGYVARMQVYKRHWHGQRVTPRGYVVGNLVLISVIGSACILGLAAVLLSDRLGPELAAPVVGIAAIAVNSPNGRPMLDAGPRTGRGP